MKFLKKNSSEINIRDKAANGLANGILKFQGWFATSLESLTKSWKQKQQWIFLCMICVGFGGLSIAAIVNSFKVSDKSKVITPKSISIPKNIYTEDKAFLITENEFQQVQEYKSKHPELIKERPGLYDSLSLIEQAYHLQIK